MFYPGRKQELQNVLQTLLDRAPVDKKYDQICGVVAPHAGYPYSGLSAAYSYNVLKNYDFETAVILSPSHREYFQGMSIYHGDAYETPLGLAPIDADLREKLIDAGEYFSEGIRGHGAEHAVEVQLPFLQMVKKDFKILPVVIGDQRKLFIDKLVEGLEQIIDPKTVVVVSSDLSHFYSKDSADKLDTIIESHIREMDYNGLQEDLESKKCEACGGGGIVALLKLASRNNFKHADVLSRTDSGDSTGDNSSVVGYLSAVVYN